MSTIDATVVLDSRVDVSSSYTELVPFTGQQVNQFEVPADGSSYTSQIYFNNIVSPGGLNSTLVGRNVRIRYNVTITSPSNGGTPVIGLPQNPFVALNAPTAAFRAFPLTSVSDTITVQINGASTTINPRQILSATQRFIPKSYLDREGLEGPVMADNRAALLADTVLTSNAAAGVPTALSPVSNQPLSRYENSTSHTRGSFLPISYTNAANVSTWVFEISEPLMVSPFTLWDNEVYLGQLNTLSVQYNYSSIQDMFVSSQAYLALDGGVGNGSIVISNPRLELCYIQTDMSLVTIPRSLKYDYENVIYFPQTFATAAGNAFVTQFNSQTLRLQTMPKMIYCFARNQIQTRLGQTQPDCFYGIGNASGQAGLSIQLGTRTGMLASASTKTIYRMTCSNGYNSTFEDWTYGSGGVIAINPQKDLGTSVGDGLAGMSSGNVNFQIQFNVNSFPQAYAGALATIPAVIEVMIVVVYGGLMDIQADTAVFNLGTLTQNEVDALLHKNKSLVSSETVAQTVPSGSGLFAKGKVIVGHGNSK